MDGFVYPEKPPVRYKALSYLVKIVIQFQDNYSHFNRLWTSSHPKFCRNMAIPSEL